MGRSLFEGYAIYPSSVLIRPSSARELKENIGPVPASSTAPPGAHTGVSTAPPLSANVTAAQGPQAKAPQSGFDKTKAVALPGAEEMAAIHKAKKADAAAKATPVSAAAEPETSTETSDDKTSSTAEKEESKEEPTAVESEPTKQEIKKEDEPSLEVVEGLRIKDDDVESKEVESKADASAKDEAKVDAEVNPKLEPKDEAKVDAKGESKVDTKDDEKTQEQSAKDPAAAGQSVDD